jgi:hypothetical protein
VRLRILVATFALLLTGCDTSRVKIDTTRVDAIVAGAKDRPPRPAFDETASTLRLDAMKKRALAADSLDEVLYEVSPEFGDLYIGDKRFAAREFDHPGAEILEKWSEKHLAWRDVEHPEHVDIASASEDADGWRGSKVCVGGTALFPKNLAGYGRIDAYYRGTTYRHILRVFGDAPSDGAEHDVRFCGVIVGRYVAKRSRHFHSGLVLVGMIDQNATMPAVDWLWDRD